MENNQNHICPWCDTEIVWDPEIGPEEECPYCYNALSGYRSITLKLKQTGEEVFLDEESEGTFTNLRGSWDEAYSKQIEDIIDQQDVAPECSQCGEYMVHAGDAKLPESDFQPAAGLKEPIMRWPPVLKTYVCPACFKVETFLGDQDREYMVRKLQGK